MQQLKANLIDLPQHGLLKVSGQGAQKLLQGQVTADIFALSEHQSCLSAHCNAQGRVISFFRLFYFEEAYYLLMHRDMVPLAQTALKKYAAFYKADITDESTSVMGIGISGVSRDAIAKNIEKSIQLISIDSNRFILLGDPKTMQPVRDNFAAQLSVSYKDTWHLMDIHAGIPTIYPETSAKFLPHELGLHKLNAISFEKGCYTGQEIIARMHYKGKLKKNLYRAELASKAQLPPGSDIYYEQDETMRPGAIVVDSCVAENSNNQTTLIVADDTIIKNNPLFINQNTRVFFSILE